jgi:5-methylcytosine-specific restriction endonuclease McrBC regulatory subunit McrC
MVREIMLLPKIDDSCDWSWLSRLLRPIQSQDSQPLEKRLGISMEWDDPKTPILHASDKVGTIQFINSASKEPMNLVIHPKVPGSVTSMLWVTLNLPEDDLFGMEKLSSGISTHPSTWLVSIYLRELERFLIMLRQRGEEVEDELISKIKGRFLVDQYIKHNYWTRRHIAPCRFVEWTRDNLPNRILLYALFLSRQALSVPSIDAPLEIGLARRCEAALADVNLVRILKDDFARVTPLLQGSFRHYQKVILFAKLVVSILDPFAIEAREIQDVPIVKAFDRGSSDDGSVKWDLVDMPVLFEQYVRAIMGSKYIGRKKFPIRLEGDLPQELAHLANKEMKLDREPIKSTSNKVCLIIDAKYEPLEFSNRIRTPRIDQEGTYHLSEHQNFDLLNKKEKLIETGNRTISNADLYQVIAYATHEDIRASSAALVYPSIKDQAIAEVSHYTGLGFRPNDIGGISVYILTIRIDPQGIKKELAGKGINKNINRILSKIENHGGETIEK